MHERLFCAGGCPVERPGTCPLTWEAPWPQPSGLGRLLPSPRAGPSHPWGLWVGRRLLPASQEGGGSFSDFSIPGKTVSVCWKRRGRVWFSACPHFLFA